MNRARWFALMRMFVMAFIGGEAAVTLWPIDILMSVATGAAFISVIATYGSEAWNAG